METEIEYSKVIKNFKKDGIQQTNFSDQLQNTTVHGLRLLDSITISNYAVHFVLINVNFFKKFPFSRNIFQFLLTEYVKSPAEFQNLYNLSKFH